MNLTNLLQVVILLILVKQFYPAIGEILVPVAIVILAAIGLELFIAYWKKQRAAKKQREEDETDFWKWQKSRDAIRAQYDPEHEWNEISTIPQEYSSEIQELNSKYQGMLRRRNGWTDHDF